MAINIRAYTPADAEAAAAIWNEVVESGVSFPQDTTMTPAEADEFFRSQSHTAVAEDEGAGVILGLYILHPNNVGRCGHTANASYAVYSQARGKHIGEALVKDSMQKAKELGFRNLQFNAVVASNIHAIHLYERLGFIRIGTVAGGFRLPDGNYEDIILFYHPL